MKTTITDIAQLKDLIIKTLEDKKARDINIMELGEKVLLARYMIFASGSSIKNISSIAENVAFELKHHGIKVSVEGLGKSEWVLLDTGDIIIHIFHPQARTHFNLEELWSKNRKS